MRLYYVQKLLYNLNRDLQIAERFKSFPETVLAGYDLSDEELSLRSGLG